MKVAAVFMSMPVGGAEDLALSLGSALAESGVETHFVCLRAEGELGKLAAREASERFHCLPVAPGKRFHPVGFLRLTNWLRREKFDLVHSHTYHGHTYAGPAARWAGIPVVLHHHKTLEKMKWLRHVMLGRLMRRADAVVALSRETATDLTHAFRLNPEKVSALPNPVDTQIFTPATTEEKLTLREALGLDPGRFLIGSVASLNPVKNHRASVQALAGVGQADLLILGEGRERAALGQLARELGVENRLRLAGNQRPIAPWLRSLDLFVLPSTWEGQSLALLQAIASGLPVLASRIEGNVAVLGIGHPGLFDPTDVSAYTELLRRAASDAGFREELVAYQSQLLLPTMQDAAARMLAIYQKAALRTS